MKKKSLLLVLFLSFVFVTGCGNSKDGFDEDGYANVLVAGDVFYVGDTKEDVDVMEDSSTPHILEMASDSAIVRSFYYNGEKYNTSLYCTSAANNYREKPTYLIMDDDGPFSGYVVAVIFGDYTYLISTDVIEDFEIDLNDEDSIIDAKIEFNKNFDEFLTTPSTDYLFYILKEA